MASPIAGLGHLHRSPSAVLPKGRSCTLRRCIRGGMIGVALFGVGPSISAHKTKRSALVFREVLKPCQR
jgi:hypothetical protein